MTKTNRLLVIFNTLLATILVLVLVQFAPSVANAGSTTIVACADKKTGSLRIAYKKCTKSENTVSWGLSGPRGATGPAGAAGLQGSSGSSGAVGPQGATGPTGPTGAQGIQGLPGTQGEQGVQGLPGANATSEFAAFYITNGFGVDILPRDYLEFPSFGPSNSSGSITPAGPMFELKPGTYRVTFQIPVTGSGLLVLALNGVDLLHTIRPASSGSVIGDVFVEIGPSAASLAVRNRSISQLLSVNTNFIPSLLITRLT